MGICQHVIGNGETSDGCGQDTDPQTTVNAVTGYLDVHVPACGSKSVFASGAHGNDTGLVVAHAAGIYSTMAQGIINYSH